MNVIPSPTVEGCIEGYVENFNALPTYWLHARLGRRRSLKKVQQCAIASSARMAHWKKALAVGPRLYAGEIIGPAIYRTSGAIFSAFLSPRRRFLCPCAPTRQGIVEAFVARPLDPGFYRLN
jgi:hypothetical protein